MLFNQRASSTYVQMHLPQLQYEQYDTRAWLYGHSVEQASRTMSFYSRGDGCTVS